LKEASAALGVNYSHLRRVLTGERASRSLIKRYRQLDRQTANPSAIREQNPRIPIGAPDTPSTPPAHGPVDPADANYLDAWVQNVVGKLGFTVVVAQMQSCLQVSEHGEIGEAIGAELSQAGLGHFDSTDWQPKTRHFFYVDARQLAKALTFVKSSLAQRNLLAFACIAYRDADVWRTYYPGIPT